MISPISAPPGTRVICKTNGAIVNEIGNVWTAPELVDGATYTVWRYRNGGVLLCEVKIAPGFGGFCLQRFELAALPKSITDCLETVDLPLIIDEFNRQDADATARLLFPY